MNSAASLFLSFRANRIARSVLRHIRPGESILDCGCGTMHVARAIRAQSAGPVFGVDTLDLNRTTLPFCLCPGERLAFASAGVDVVLLIGVLHHTRRARQVLTECLRVARRSVIVLEDVPGAGWELTMLKALDWLGNRPLSGEMNLPYEFRSDREWRSIFGELGTPVRSAEAVRPNPWRPSRHRLYVLDRPNPRSG